MGKFITKLVIKLNPKYIGWCAVAYQFYRMKGMSKYKAWKGAFLSEF